VNYNKVVREEKLEIRKASSVYDIDMLSSSLFNLNLAMSESYY